jgi:hypothetical protein
MDVEAGDNDKNPDPVVTDANEGAAGKPAKASAEAKDKSPSRTVWQDEKATANAKHDRRENESRNEPLGDALSMGAGQVSSPYLTQTQANAIARQANRKDGK